MLSNRNSKKHRNLITLLAVIATVSSVSLGGPSIPQGIQFAISPQGIEFFKTNLEYVLKKNRTDLGNMKFTEEGFELKNPFNVQKLPLSVQKNKKSQLDQITDRLGRYFTALPIDRLNLNFKLHEMSYQARFKSMGIEIDPNGLTNYGLKSGLVGLLRLEAPEVLFSLDKLTCTDTQIPQIFGQMSVQSFTAKLKNGNQRPLRVEIPLHLDVDSKGLNIRAVGFKTNLNQVVLEGAFGKMKLPKISVNINGQDYPMDMLALERDVRETLPPIMEVLSGAVKGFFEKDGPALLEENLATLSKAANIQFQMTIPGSPSGSDQLDVSLQATKVKLEQGHAKLIFKTELRDPTFLDGQGSFDTVGRATEPTYSLDRPYDVAFAVHPGIINGMIQRAFDLKYMSTLDVGEGEKVALLHPPVFDFSQDQTGFKGKIKVSIAHAVKGGLDGLIVQKPIPISFEIGVRLEVLNKNQVDIVIDSLDEKSIQVVTKDVTLLGLFQKKVKAKVIERLRAVNESFKNKREVVGSIPTPDDIIGIPIRLIQVQTNHGMLVLYSTFDAEIKN